MSSSRLPIHIVIADAGPLVSLAAARRLDLLECFDRPINRADRLALVRPKGTRKTQWTEAAKKPGRRSA